MLAYRPLQDLKCGALRYLSVIVLIVLPGCSSVILLPGSSSPESFLKPVETSPESVALEILQVRLPASEKEMLEELWEDADELRLDVAVRHELVRNGFRAGVLGGAIPDELSELLQPEDDQPADSSQRVITGENADPKVSRRVVQLNRQNSAIVQTADLRDQVHVLLSENSGIRGRSYQQAEAIYSIQAAAASGQRAEVRLVPELRHGEIRNRYAGGDRGQGIFLMIPSRERETYDQLTMRAELAAGEMLLVSCLPDASGSLGHAFHAEDLRGPTEYQLVFVRLLQVPHSEILASLER
jgi:hypothetical protein